MHRDIHPVPQLRLYELLVASLVKSASSLYCQRWRSKIVILFMLPLSMCYGSDAHVHRL
ncbi:hypothetical protein KC19_VG101600 [Ceratodon purpureus]|uniref:Uncharacterized protein n=1 Tax=Ceratodon purpureus TaxID=3225 RepID=A0A8T0HNZ0_CERPU|nr:hypothetical protein KC19_VG101600 [Ceratodon purpureus]